ncbi:DUF2147 domain-containing protein [Bradyrhizobium sp. ARR65]|uniref:DUF2147 domain-containing protein n=1 Tax=Bradyrhizobium sp. ARR65 TaxID=1040989 RepID=UPI0004650371|nr:DUF2147 domain-containing protein [Bradyrhizobium sp. ARR65]
MTRLLALAAFLFASSAAQAQYTFHYGGHTIHIDPDRGIVSIPGIYDNTGRKAKRIRNHDRASARKQQQPPQEAKVEPQPQTPAAPPGEAAATPAPAQTAVTPSPAAPTTDSPPPAEPEPTTMANSTPADAAMSPPPASHTAAPVAQQDAAAKPAAAAAPNSQPAPVPAALRDPNSPLGVWLTEEKEGKVRIEQCGANLCGYSVDAKTNQNGEQVLINMKPGKDLKWSGRILDPNTGSTYDSTIALKGPDTLRVQGCAFGGMFCGGQTWTRVN